MPAGMRMRPPQPWPAVAVRVFPTFRGAGSVPQLRAAARAALAVGDIPVPGRVSLVVADDRTVRSLNAQYRGLDEVTDVLAFAWDHQGPWEGPGHSSKRYRSATFAIPGRKTSELGEVIIAYPQAERQAREKGHSVDREVALLVVHGVLHLMGYDHAQPKEEARMRALESAALARCEKPNVRQLKEARDGR